MGFDAKRVQGVHIPVEKPGLDYAGSCHFHRCCMLALRAKVRHDFLAQFVDMHSDVAVLDDASSECAFGLQVAGLCELECLLTRMTEATCSFKGR